MTKYLMFDLDDERITSLSDVLSNKTSRKILEYLSDSEASEGEIARDLKLPANTINYNVKKLLKSGLIEKSKKFFWSVKGKKILRYRVANKKIIISPKSFSGAKKMAISLVGTGIVALAVQSYLNSRARLVVEKDLTEVADFGGVAAGNFSDKALEVGMQTPEIIIWFVLGGLTALIILALLNWKKLKKV